MSNPASETIEDAIRRPRRYWNADGIPEIAIGVFWLLWAAIVLVPVAIPTLARWKNLISILGILLAPWLLEFVVRKWKERITYPRTGYIKLASLSGSVRAAVILIAAVLGGAVMLLVRFGGHVIGDWMGVAVGVVISLTLLQLAWRMRSIRLALLCWVVTGVGIAATIFQVARETSTIMVFFAAGVVCALDGALRLRSYVESHPFPAGEQP